MNSKEIAEKPETSPKVVSRWVSAYKKKKNGIEALFNKRQGGNHRIIPELDISFRTFFGVFKRKA